MSYIVQIWEQPQGSALPASIHEAAQLVGELLQRKSGSNPLFGTLARTLMQRYPSIDSMPVEDGEDEPRIEDCAWIDQPIYGYSDDAVFNLGISSSKLTDVLPYVVEVATQLGLCVLDGQAGAAYLPGGRVLSGPQAATPPQDEGDDEELPRTRELARTVFERLTPMMQQHGFKARKSSLSFKRSFPGGWHEVYLDASTDMWPIACKFNVGATTRLDVVSELAEAIAWPDHSPEANAERSTAVSRQRDWLWGQPATPTTPRPDEYKVHKPAEIEGTITHLIRTLEARVLSILPQCETLEGLEAVLNPAPPQKSVFHGLGGNYTALMAAYLVHNPRLEEMLAALRPVDLGDSTALQRCFDYLRGKLASGG